MDEPIPTPNGWKLLGELEIGDFVFGPDGIPCRVIARTDVFTDPECYEVTFDDGTAMKAGADHLWTVERRTRKRVAGTYKIGAGKRLYRESVTLSTREIATLDHAADQRLAIPVNDPLVLPDAKLPIAPYVLGVWLGDGTVGSARITCGLQDAGEVERHLTEAGAAVERARHSNAITLRIGSGRRGNRASSDFANALRTLGVYRDKHIPASYQRASTNQRVELLRGLMDSDGYCNPRGTAYFSNKSERLIEGVYELAAALGLKPSKFSTENPKYGRYWRVVFQAYQDRNPFKLERKAKRAKAGARLRPRRYIIGVEKLTDPPKMRCIQVDRADGLYLAGRQMVTTHNSTIITFGLSLQDVLASHGEDPEARYGGREVTIGIFSHNRPIAKQFLRQIKIEAETNLELQALFPDVLWGDALRDAPKWSEDEGLIFRRKGNAKEGTIEAWGLVDGQPTSKHFVKRNYDDVVTERSVTPDMIPKTTAAWELSENLGTEGGTARYVGTRYALFDTYATMVERQIPARIYPCTSDGSEDWTKSVLRSPEFLAEKRRLQGPYTFGAQMLLNPRADKAQGFQEAWLKYWPATNTTDLNLYIIVDPGGSKKRPDNDFTSMWVIGVGGDHNYYLVDGVRDRLRLTERANWLFKLHRLYRPNGVGYEEYGMQADIEHIEYVMGVQNYRFSITPLGGPLGTNDRIKRLVPICEQGRLFLPHSGIVHVNHEGHQVNIVRQFVQEEYLAFPACAHDDMLSNLSRILDEELGVTFPEPDTHKQPKWMRDFADEELGGDDDWLTQ